MNLITAITTNGLTINMLKAETIDANFFNAFLRYVIKMLREEGFSACECGVILDNCSIHRSDLVKAHWRETRIKLFYIPHYSLELDPVEFFFSLLKRRFVQECKRELLNLWTTDSIKSISKWIHNIESGFILKLWHRLMGIIRGELDNKNLRIL